MAAADEKENTKKVLIVAALIDPPLQYSWKLLQCLSSCTILHTLQYLFNYNYSNCPFIN